MIAEWALLGASLAGAGLLAGFIGGLFGVGGGVVIAPALFYLFAALGVPDEVRAHLAIGTSLSTILATSWRSLSTHLAAGKVDTDILKTWTPWIALGAVIGGLAAGLVSGEALLLVFGGGLLLVAANLGLGRDEWRLAEAMPIGAVRAGLGGAIGALSAMMGIGGGAFGVTLMTLCGRPIHQAVATASGFGAAIAAPGAFLYILTGWGAEGLPPGALGYVHMPGFIIVGALTALTAPMGARLAHRLDRTLLKRCFAVFLALMALNLLREGLS